MDSRENKRKWTDSSQVTQSYLILQMNKSTHTHMRCSDKPCHQSETSCESDADGFEDPELRPQPVVGQVPMMFNIINWPLSWSKLFICLTYHVCLHRHHVDHKQKQDDGDHNLSFSGRWRPFHVHLSRIILWHSQRGRGGEDHQDIHHWCWGQCWGLGWQWWGCEWQWGGELLSSW